MIPDNVKKYLKKYSLPGWKIEHAGLDNINNALVIPAIQEFENIKILLSSFAENDKTYFPLTLLIFVVNNSINTPASIKEENKKTIDYLKLLIKKNNDKQDSISKKVISSGLRLSLVNASSPGNELPAKEAGVGMARKIGMDLALTIFNYNSSAKKILLCLDADCTVEKNYLTEVIENFNKKNLTAAVINFKHTIPDEKEKDEAITAYEIFLRYYVLGLKYAGSPYAFHTIGSTMACDVNSYVKVEGMNKRKAAEDFYFLEKLAKITMIERINSTTVYPAGRASWRVPFGTGQRVSRFLSKTHDEYLLYNPQSFYILKEWLDIFINDNNILDAELYLEKARLINKILFEFLQLQKFKNSWTNILKNCSDREHLKRQKKDWFDGFRTMKLIHFFRDNGFPMINMFDAMDEFLYKIKLSSPIRNEKIPNLKIQKEYLEILRNIT
jgi:hypothetical protein